MCWKESFRKNYITRQSASILSAIGLSNWIIRNENEYIKRLKKLANLKTISKLRLTLRKKIIKSLLCNGQEFAKNFENSMKDILKIK